MILIADGGSTKTDLVLLDSLGEVVLKTHTPGLNPSILSSEEIISHINKNEELLKLRKDVSVVDFYGAGCGTDGNKKILKDILSEIFPKAKVKVAEDMIAAVYAATTEPGIVCILGTGSNSCYFDGKEIHQEIKSLGYVLMDEASGNYFGKQLIRDYYYKKMPAEIATEFEKRFDLDADTIQINLYKKPNPNKYLASFAEFIFTYETKEPYFSKLLKEGISHFIESRVLCFKEAQELPVHFIGSIAHFSAEIIKDCLKNRNLQPGNIIKRPIDGLIEYYKLNKTESL